jgi:hypothetical protein
MPHEMTENNNTRGKAIDDITKLDESLHIIRSRINRMKSIIEERNRTKVELERLQHESEAAFKAIPHLFRAAKVSWEMTMSSEVSYASWQPT